MRGRWAWTGTAALTIFCVGACNQSGSGQQRRGGEPAAAAAADNQRQITEAYNVADLLADPAVLAEAKTGEKAGASASAAQATAMGQLIRVLTTTVQPDEWAENGGELGRTSVLGSTLVVTAPPAMQNGVKDVLARLRAAQTAAQGEKGAKSRK